MGNEVAGDIAILAVSAEDIINGMAVVLGTEYNMGINRKKKGNGV